MTLIGEAVFARCLSAMKEERVAAAAQFPRKASAFSGDKAELIDSIKQALYASKITSYAQGLSLLRLASAEYKYDMRPGPIA